MSSAGVLPSYQRFPGPAAGQLFGPGRRSFRPREKYLILLVFLTFGVVCFGAFFFLPDDYRANGATVNSVYRVYQRMQKAGPELLMPKPPHAHRDDLDPQHHEDPRLMQDKQKLQVSQLVSYLPPLSCSARARPSLAALTPNLYQPASFIAAATAAAAPTALYY